MTTRRWDECKWEPVATRTMTPEQFRQEYEGSWLMPDQCLLDGAIPDDERTDICTVCGEEGRHDCPGGVW